MSSLMRKYVAYVVVDLFCMIFLWIPGVIIGSIFTKPGEHGKDLYDWGMFSLWGTFDNPPRGDRRWEERGSFFPGEITGFKGYLNRVGWLLRNPMYGLARKLSLHWQEGYRIETSGDPDISDKYRRPGTFRAKLFDRKGKQIGFEYYTVKPWSKNRCLRVRVGWKIKSSKVQETGIIQFVFTCNPFDGFGDE